MRRLSRAFIGVGCVALLAACSAGDAGTAIPKGVPDDAGSLPDRVVPRTDARIDTPRVDATVLPDGRVVYPDVPTSPPDGTVSAPDATVALPDGSTVLPDGAVMLPDGAVIPYPDAGSAPDASTACGDREVCDDGVDNNCNGRVDEGCACIPGMTQRCYDGPPSQAGRGVCVYGMQRCEGTGEFGSWSSCTGSGSPQPVVCGRMMDFRCNGNIDEGCDCTPGMTRSCYSGPMGTSGVGACRAGSQTCTMTPTGSAWGTCTGEVLPGTRDLCDGVDRDCNGTANEGCTCAINAARSCYSGPAGTSGVGACRAGTQRCVAGPGGVGTTWGTCTGETLPMADQCDGVDRNCDGNANTGCTCPAGTTRPCYTGPAGTSGVGICRPGTQTCTRVSATSTTWGTACSGEILPGASEVCGNMRDDNCNGAVDEGCTTTPMCPTGFDLTTDVNNCGRCGNRCAAGEACVAGVCVGNGQLRITMTWDRMGDMDLHVVPPCGTEIYYGRLTACGGDLDVDSCPAQTPSSRYPSGTDPCTGPENIFWAAAPANGTYVVCANPWALSTTVNYRVTVTRGTTVIRTWTGSRSGSAGYRACSPTAPSYIGSFTIP